ncbi:MAG: cupredoxin domain-containing protein [Thermomicrobiales bacterium]|nr:cupredoxin domain-containing protein [Thermomicrobiales bacterium]
MHALRSVRVVLALVATLALPLALLQHVAVVLAQAETVTVEVGADGFSPQEVTVPAGTTVVWTNSGASLESVVADDGSFDSFRLDPGEQFSFTFDTPGEFTYSSTFGSGATGTVIVTGADSASSPTAVPAGTEAPVASVASTAGESRELLPAEQSRLAHIHAGNCDELGIVVYSLPDIRTYRVGGNAGTVGTVELIAGQANVPLEQLFTEPFSVHIHESPTNKATYLACADIGGTPNAPWTPTDGLVLEATEQNDSGFSGLVTLMPSADGSATDVAVTLAASADALAAAVAQTPAPSTTYTSPTFGYTIGYGETWQETENVSHNGRDRFVLFNGTSYITFTGEEAFNGDPQACVDTFVQQLIADPNVSDARLATDEQGQPLEGGTAATGAFAIYDHDYDFGNRVEPYTLFVGCVPLREGEAVLAIVQNVPTEDYNQQLALREALLRGLTLAQ